MEGAFWLWDTGPEMAYQNLDEAEEQHESEQKKCDEMAHLASMFECGDKMGPVQAMMDDTKKLLDRARDM